MAMAEAISPGALILIIFLQNTFAQQCLSNQVSQLAFQRSNYGPNQIPQTGINYSPLQQENVYQTNYQQQPNIQQALPIQPVNNQQPPINYQQGYSQQPAYSIDSEVKMQRSQDLASKIFSALYNIQQSSQNQKNINSKGNPSQQMIYEQQLSQNQPNSAFIASTPMNQGQNSQSSVTNSYSETAKFQPTFTYQAVPSSNTPVQENQQIFTVPVHKVSTNDQTQSQNEQKQQASSIVMVPGAHMNNLQSQPIVLTFQPSQMPTSHSQPTLLTSQSNEIQPVIFTSQNPPSSSIYRHQQNSDVLSQMQGSNNHATDVDKQSLISYILSQMPNSYNSGNALATILPEMLNTKPDKSLSMKTLLPLIFSILNDKKGCCECPHCGCNHDHNQNNVEKLVPLINSGYSNQINYSQPKPVDVSTKLAEPKDKSLVPTGNNTKQDKSEDEVMNNSEETSEEDDEGIDSGEEYDEE